MTPRATRVLTLAVAGALTLCAAASWACDKSTKSASASSCCLTKGTSVAAKSCSAPASMTAKKSTPAKAAKATAAKKAAPTEAGMRAYRDPETGLLTTPPAFKAIGEDGLPVLAETPDDLPQYPNARGGWVMDMQGYGQDYATLQIDAKGNRVISCSPNPRAQLKKSVAAPQQSSLAFPEK